MKRRAGSGMRAGACSAPDAPLFRLEHATPPSVLRGGGRPTGGTQLAMLPPAHMPRGSARGAAG